MGRSFLISHTPHRAPGLEEHVIRHDNAHRGVLSAVRKDRMKGVTSQPTDTYPQGQGNCHHLAAFATRDTRQQTGQGAPRLKHRTDGPKTEMQEAPLAGKHQEVGSQKA